MAGPRKWAFAKSCRRFQPDGDQEVAEGLRDEVVRGALAPRREENIPVGDRSPMHIGFARRLNTESVTRQRANQEINIIIGRPPQSSTSSCVGTKAACSQQLSHEHILYRQAMYDWGTLNNTAPNSGHHLTWRATSPKTRVPRSTQQHFLTSRGYPTFVSAKRQPRETVPEQHKIRMHSNELPQTRCKTTDLHTDSGDSAYRAGTSGGRGVRSDSVQHGHDHVGE